jgi:hypothetical protein
MPSLLSFLLLPLPSPQYLMPQRPVPATASFEAAAG